MSVLLLTEHRLEHLSLKEAAQALSLHLSKCHTVEITWRGSNVLILSVRLTQLGSKNRLKAKTHEKKTTKV